MQIKTTMKHHLTLVGLAMIKKNLQTVNAGKDVENVNLYSHYGDQYRDS